jgi:hypothetical protein
MNWPARHIGGEGLALVARRARDIEQAAKHRLTNRTSIGPALALATTPRLSPDVDCSAMVRTVVSFRCACTSSVIGAAPSRVMTSASSIGGSAAPLKATSTTARRTAITRPSIVLVCSIVLCSRPFHHSIYAVLLATLSEAFQISIKFYEASRHVRPQRAAFPAVIELCSTCSAIECIRSPHWALLRERSARHLSRSRR